MVAAIRAGSMLWFKRRFSSTYQFCGSPSKCVIGDLSRCLEDRKTVAFKLWRQRQASETLGDGNAEVRAGTRYERGRTVIHKSCYEIDLGAPT